MPNYYAVVQYVPDLVRDERINVGVIAFGDGSIRSEFIQDWSRPKAFGGEDLTFLKEFGRHVRESQQEQLPLADPSLATITEELLRTFSATWRNSIQITEPRASLLDTNELLRDVAARFLMHRQRAKREFRDRRAAASLARAELNRALGALGATHHLAVKLQIQVAGSLDQHRFDVGLVNGSPRLAVQGMSFEGQSANDILREVDATAWRIDDVLRADKEFPIAIVALPPKSGKGTSYANARRVFDGLGATFVPEAEVADWATESTHRAAA